MIPQAYITAWRAVAPWPDDAQVEHDLVLSRVVIELFSMPELTGKFALRGGTALNKLFVDKPARYSEDIDLVQISAGPIGPLIEIIRKRLDPLFIKASFGSSAKMFTLTYRFESEIEPVQQLKLKLEINTREHFSVLGFVRRPLGIDSRWYSGQSTLLTYTIDELMGTKLRALYQRKKGRDLFDLWLCLSQSLVDPDKVIRCFHRYMEAESHPVTRAALEENLAEKLQDEEFLGDIKPLLASDIQYDAKVAMQIVMEMLISRVP